MMTNYEVTSPEFVQGAPIATRKRRSDHNLVVYDDDDDREVKFDAFGETFHVKLERNDGLIRRGLVVERVAADGTVTEEDAPRRDCYYFGHLLSHEGQSAAALSTCNGLRGIISHGDADYFIAPLKDHHALRFRRSSAIDPSLGEGVRPHVVYKRTARPRTRRSSATSASLSSEVENEGGDEIEHDVDNASDNDSDDYDDEALMPDNGTDSFCWEVFAHDQQDNYTYHSLDTNNDDQHENTQNPYNDYGDNGTTWHQAAFEGGNARRVSADMAASQEEVEHTQEDGMRYMEFFIVIDPDMVQRHGEDVIEYTLTLMNIVSRRYAETSLRAEIRLAIVKMVIAEANNFSMTAPDGRNYSFLITGNGPELLPAFCEWQQHFNPPSDSDPQHWDLASLITRKDLYKLTASGQRNYGLLGRAYIGEICNPDTACQINEDDGLECGLVIAHETGHNLNLLHDPDYGCPNGWNIMASMRTSGPGSFKWSTCSAEHLGRFLESPRSACLLDRPGVDILPFDILPGVKYNRLAQCRLKLGPQIQHMCGNNRYSSCSQVGCVTGYWCQFISIMEGTFCGRDRWCLAGFCISSIGGIPDPIHGGWSPYDGNFTVCSRTCGGGVRWKRRYCNNPTPRFGGEPCEGPAAKMELCNTDVCPDGVKTADAFREEGCAANTRPYQNQQYNWTAYLDAGETGDSLCKLMCARATSTDSDEQIDRGVVTDGTQCWDDEEPDELQRRRYCVDRNCEEFGCDGVYKSGKIFDVCGVCEGSGRTCTHVSGSFARMSPRYRQWWTIITVPVGSTGVMIRNENFQYNHLALSAGGVDMWRAGFMERGERKRYSHGGMLIRYNWREYDWSKIQVLTGPTTEEIVVDVYQEKRTAIFGTRVNPVIHYEWYQPITELVTYFWDQAAATECSVTCGGGNLTLSTFCYEEIAGALEVVSDRLCYEPSRPTEVYEDCNTQLCPGLGWLTGSWGLCSVTCGPGTRHRTVDCVYGETLAPAADSECNAEVGERPSTSEACEWAPCPTTAPTTTAVPITVIPTSLERRTTYATSVPDIQTTVAETDRTSTATSPASSAEATARTTTPLSTAPTAAALEAGTESVVTQGPPPPPLGSIPSRACALQWGFGFNLVVILSYSYVISHVMFSL